MQSPDLLNQEQAASLLGIASRTLEDWRQDGKGPAYIRVSARCIRYRRESLAAFLAAREVPCKES